MAGAPDFRTLAAACGSVRTCCTSGQAAGEGRLDQALGKLARAIDPSSPAKSRIEVLESIVAYIQAGRILALLDPPLHAQRHAQDEMEVEGAGAGESGAAVSAAVRGLARTLGRDIPGSVRSGPEAIQGTAQALQQLLEQVPPSIFEPLVNEGAMAQAQRDTLAEIDEVLRREYTIRRKVSPYCPVPCRRHALPPPLAPLRCVCPATLMEMERSRLLGLNPPAAPCCCLQMLIERVRVTLQSFAASPRLPEKGLEAEARAAIEEGSASLQEAPGVRPEDVFSVTLGDLVDVAAKATGGDRGVRASVKGVLIGSVSDGHEPPRVAVSDGLTRF